MATGELLHVLATTEQPLKRPDGEQQQIKNKTSLYFHLAYSWIIPTL